MKNAIGVVSAAALVFALHAPAQGFDLRIGANANYGTSNDFGVGPRVELDLKDYFPGLRLAADYHKFFVSNTYGDIEGLNVDSDAWDIGVHALFDLVRVPVLEGATIYAGGGLLYASRDYDHSQTAAADTTTPEDLLARNGRLLKLQEEYKSDSGVGVALSVGSTFNTGWTVIPFIEARYTIGVVDELGVAAGILFSTGAGDQ